MNEEPGSPQMGTTDRRADETPGLCSLHPVFPHARQISCSSDWKPEAVPQPELVQNSLEQPWDNANDSLAQAGFSTQGTSEDERIRLRNEAIHEYLYGHGSVEDQFGQGFDKGWQARAFSLPKGATE